MVSVTRPFLSQVNKQIRGPIPQFNPKQASNLEPNVSPWTDHPWFEYAVVANLSIDITSNSKAKQKEKPHYIIPCTLLCMCVRLRLCCVVIVMVMVIVIVITDRLTLK